MTIRAKVFLFALLAVGLVCLMGVHLFAGALQSQRARDQVLASQEQLESYHLLGSLAWPYINQLAQTRLAGNETALVRRDLMARVDQEMKRLGASLEREAQPLEERPPERERQEMRELRETMRAWAEWAESRVRALPEGSSVGSTVEWLLYSRFEQTVGQHLQDVEDAEQAELRAQRVRWDENIVLGQQLAVFFPLLCIVLVVALGFAILSPMRRSLRELSAAAERIGRGDFDVRTPHAGHDELGMLARAFDRMAHELRGSLEEKQRLLRAEAEAAQRYQSLLEKTVLERTVELAETNDRLQDSLYQLQNAQEQLLFADRLASVGRLAAGVGHEINNPLAFILSNLRYVHQELDELMGAPTEEARQEMLTALSEASEGAERVRFIVQDLRSMARPDDVEMGPVDVATVVQAAGKMARHELRDRARFVEECSGMPRVKANATRLGQVFLNLFINAAHAIEPGRVNENEVRVVARLSEPGRVTVEVRDTGGGIPPEHLRRIFDPFFTTKPKGVGTGLGLSVCHRIITALGGDIRVESAPGRGTSFFITLLVAEDAGGSSEQSAA